MHLYYEEVWNNPVEGRYQNMIKEMVWQFGKVKVKEK